MLSSHRPSAAATISAATAAAVFLPFQPESSFNPICRQSSSAALPTAIHAAVPRWTGEAVEAAAAEEEERGAAAVTPVTIEREKEEEQR